jgi:ABC-type dipeptide/oligopeptide/nickel transport system permease subunit
LVILATVALVALFAPLLAPHDPLEQHLLARRQPPSLEHPMGLDELGRDNLSRVLYGTRLSLRIGVTAVLVAVAVGGLLGTVAGYRGGLLDGLIVSLTDGMLAMPSLLLALAVIMILGRGLTNVLYAVAFTQVPTYARRCAGSQIAVARPGGPRHRRLDRAHPMASHPARMPDRSPKPMQI